MAYVPGCRHDLFISYASENNRDGWVDHFATALGHELADLLGRQFIPKESIYLDSRQLEVGQNFPERLTEAARGSAVLLPILSPGYLTSHWCNRERTGFFSRLPHGAAPPDCLAPILFRPIDESGLDTLFHDAQRLSFLGPDNQTPLPAGSPAWADQLRRLAGQLKHALQSLRRKCRPVFVGKAGGTDLRSLCQAELERRCFRIVPESLHALDNAESVRASLQEAGLAVHFLGAVDAFESIEASVEVCAGSTFVYQPFGAVLTTDEKFWLDDFERRLKASPGNYQRLTGKNDQELFALIDEQMTRFREDPGAAQPKIDLALVCDEPDLNSVRQLKADVASQSSYILDLPDFLGAPLKAMERLRKWQDYLSRGDAHLFYYGVAERNRLELIWQKAEASRPGGRRHWYFAAPGLEDKLQQQPEALSTVDQVIRFVEGARSAGA